MSIRYSNADLHSAEIALRKSLSELTLDFGASLAGAPSNRQTGGEDLRGRALSWIERNWGQLQSLVCGAPALAKLGQSAVDVCAIADAIGALVNKPMGFTVAAILLKYGVERLCNPMRDGFEGGLED
jgi:hypothetical protein